MSGSTPAPTLVLSQSDVVALAELPLVIEAVREAFVAHDRAQARMPPKVYLDLPEHGGDFRAMPAAAGGVAGVKWVNSHPHNPERHGLPTVLGVYVLNDAASARPLAIMDAGWLTAVRTGAAAAIASAALARSVSVVGLVGCGVQARTLAAAHRALFGPGLELLAYDANPQAAERFAAEVGARVVRLDELASCDVINTSTPARAPVLPDLVISAGTHINAMGADAEGKQELEIATLARALVVVDDVGQAHHSGEVNVALSTGAIDPASVERTLGAVLSGRSSGRTDPAQITVFDSTGLAVQDLVVAHRIYERARATQRGTPIALIDPADGAHGR